VLKDIKPEEAKIKNNLAKAGKQLRGFAKKHGKKQLNAVKIKLT
jgi:hypothetical protein